MKYLSLILLIVGLAHAQSEGELGTINTITLSTKERIALKQGRLPISTYEELLQLRPTKKADLQSAEILSKNPSVLLLTQSNYEQLSGEDYKIGLHSSIELKEAEAKVLLRYLKNNRVDLFYDPEALTDRRLMSLFKDLTFKRRFNAKRTTEFLPGEILVYERGRGRLITMQMLVEDLRRESELKEGDYQGLAGVSRQFWDWISGSGTYAIGNEVVNDSSRTLSGERESETQSAESEKLGQTDRR